MEIKIRYSKTGVLSIQFGYKTPWFESAYFITIIKEVYGNDQEIVYADLLKGFFERRIK